MSVSAEHADKIRKVMLDHLTARGYPNLSDKEIMAELKPMWLALEEAGLILPGMTYRLFCAHAQQAAIYAQMEDAFSVYTE